MYSPKKMIQPSWPKIPKDLLALYENNSFITKLYIKLRWRLCPFFKIKDYIPLEGNILDLGCGLGILSNILALNSANRIIHGFDISTSRINEALKTIKNRNNIDFSIKDLNYIDYNYYNTIIMSDFLHHLNKNDQINTLKNIYHNLNKKSRLIILDVNNNNSLKYHFANIIDFILNRKMSNFRSTSEWVLILRNIGFIIENTVDLSKGLPLSDFLITAIK